MPMSSRMFANKANRPIMMLGDWSGSNGQDSGKTISCSKMLQSWRWRRRALRLCWCLINKQRRVNVAIGQKEGAVILTRSLH